MITVDSKQFRRAAQLASACIERRNTIPVLDAMRVRANGKLELSGTDLDMQIDVTLPCDKPGKGNVDFLIGDHRFVTKAIGAAGGSTVRFMPSDKGLGIAAGALSIDMEAGAHVDEWPNLLAAHQGFTARLSVDHIRLIERTLAAMSIEETRYYLNGVYLHHEKDWTWRAVTTDGHRLMIAELSLPDATGELPSVGKSQGIIIPRKAIQIAIAAMRKSDDGIVLQAGDRMGQNSVESTAPARSDLPLAQFGSFLDGMQYRLVTKCIDGTYPDYKRVVPADHAFGMTVPIARLRQAIDAVSFASGWQRPAIRIGFFKGEIELSIAHAAGKLTARYRMAAEHDAPKDFVIGFNGQYLRDCLGALRGDAAYFGMTDSAAPTVIRDPEDTAFLSVLMPMRV